MGEMDHVVDFVDDLAALVHNLRVVTDKSGEMLTTAWGNAAFQAKQEAGYVAPQVDTCEELAKRETEEVKELWADHPLGAFSVRYFCETPPHVRLMSVDAPGELEDKGNSLLIVALVGGDLHIRIFDASGNMVVDKTQNELIPGEALTALKARLPLIPGESKLSQEEKQQIIEYATSTAGHNPSPSAIIADLTPEDYEGPLLKASSNMMVDMGVLMTRVRQDSDVFRRWLARGGTEQMLRMISGELHFLNASMATMVRDMSVMSYSAGSTAGRMGRWMPW